MLIHAPAGYECPFCALVAGDDTELNAQSDKRHDGDDLYGGDADVRWTTPEERAPYATGLRSALGADGRLAEADG